MRPESLMGGPLLAKLVSSLQVPAASVVAHMCIFTRSGSTGAVWSDLFDILWMLGFSQEELTAVSEVACVCSIFESEL